MKPIVSILLVHYHRKDLLIACIQSIYESRPKASFEILVIDNDERATIPSDLKKIFPKVQYIRAPGNVGYGRSNNLGASKAKGKFLLILNPDSLVKKGMIDLLQSFLAVTPKAGAAAPTLYDPKNKRYLQQGSSILTPLEGIVVLSFINKFFPNNPIARRYLHLPISTQRILPMEVIPGTAFMIKTAVYKKMSGFDERFFLYFEEFDLCKRLYDAGYQNYILSDAKLVHYWKASTPSSPHIQEIFQQSRKYYFQKHFGLPAALIVELFARTGIRSTFSTLKAKIIKIGKLPEDTQ